MTSVPKPLKYLRPHYARLKAVFESYTDATNKVCIRLCNSPLILLQASASDIVSLLAMTNDNEERECLRYYKSGSRQTMGTWGHEYVRYVLLSRPCHVLTPQPSCLRSCG